MSGWKIDSPKYKITEALFNEIWESLEFLADVDKDGKITKTEWVSENTFQKKWCGGGCHIWLAFKILEINVASIKKVLDENYEIKLKNQRTFTLGIQIRNSKNDLNIVAL